MRRLKTLKIRGGQTSAYCRNCNWSTVSGWGDDGGKGATSSARYHAGKNNHSVEIFRERAKVIKPQEND